MWIFLPLRLLICQKEDEIRIGHARDAILLRDTLAYLPSTTWCVVAAHALFFRPINYTQRRSSSACAANTFMAYPELTRLFYARIQQILEQRGSWNSFNDHHQLWAEVKKQESLGFNPLLDGSIDLEEPDPDDYPLID